MYSRLSNAPSKSMSDILEATQSSQQTCANALRGLPCKPCKTYSYDNLNTREAGVQVESDTRKFENGRDSPVNSRTSKLHNFVRRVVASLERRSDERGDCKADNEFFAKYTKPSCSNLATQRFPENVSFFRSSQEETCADYDFINKRVTRSTEGKKDNPKNFCTVSFERNKICTETRVSLRNLIPHGTNECSSEDRFNRTHANTEDNETRMRKVKTLPASMRESQNISRKKSFKSLFTSIIRRKKSEKLFKSCDDLNEKSAKYDETAEMMFRTVSLQNVTDNNKVPQNFTTACVVYDSEKFQSIVQSSESRTASHIKNGSGYSSGFFMSEEISDNSVRLPIVRNIAKRFSQVSNYSQFQRDTVASSLERNVHHKKCVMNYSDDMSASKKFELSQRESSAVSIDRKLETEY